MRKNPIAPLLIALSFFSCKEKVIEPATVKGLEYYPLSTGRFVEYEADSTVYTEVPKDTLYYKYRIKEKIVEEYVDNQGVKTHRLERYIKQYDPQTPYENMTWQTKEAWLVKANTTRVQVQENNNLFTKLIFPTLINASWDGNAYNVLGKTTYSYEYIDRAETINSVPLSRVLKVKEKTDTTNKIVYQLQYEQYAADVGLVFREYTHLESNNIVDSIPLKNRIEKGVVYTLRILNYGTE
jgi:hypothetical protein